MISTRARSQRPIQGYKLHQIQWYSFSEEVVVVVVVVIIVLLLVSSLLVVEVEEEEVGVI